MRTLTWRSADVTGIRLQHWRRDALQRDDPLKPQFLLLLPAVLPVWGVDSLSRQIPVEITHEKGSFSGQLTVSLNGSMNKAKATWNATIRNTSRTKIFRVTFCVRAFDPSDQEIRPGGNECVIRLWGSNWEPGSPLTFKGNQNIKISDEKTPVQVAKYTITATEVFDHSPNLRSMDVRCPLVWSSAIRVFADKKFRPTVMDKDSFTATYAYDGGRVDSGSTNFLKTYTTAYTGWTMIWESFRVDNASLYLREETPGTCTAEVKMSFAGFGKPMFGQYGWYAVESNFNFEKALLDSVAVQSKQAATSDLDKAISQLPAGPPKAVEGAAKPQLTITSEPTGAEIEIDGEFIGSTPTTVTAKEGSVTVKVKKAGFQPWERSLKLNPGDKRTLNAEMVR
ncbi:MAG: PEGA domain-containing protein [Acidobacteria bacterium]|nr:PEGA domain-containing protein [Acidobacteriota bacterium]